MATIPDNIDLNPRSDLESELIVIEVGEDKKTFLAHKDVLTKYPYFRKCLASDRFAEAETRKITFPEEDPEVFARVLEYIYFDRIPYVVPEILLKPPKPYISFDSTHPFVKLMAQAIFGIIRAYALADRLCVEPLKNALLDLYVRYSERWTLTGTELQYLTQYTPRYSLLRQWALKALACDIRLHGWDAYKAENSDTWEDFLQGDSSNAIDVLEVMTGIGDYDEAFKELFDNDDPCRWHEHIDTPRCTAQLTT